MSVFSFVGGRFPLAATASRSPLPPLAYCGAIKGINHGLHGWHGLNHLKSQSVISSPSRSRSQSVILKHECGNHGTHGMEMGVV